MTAADPQPTASTVPTAFASRLLQWFDHHGRHDLPWQHPRTPYRVWLSEVMLQQTQVATVIPYFERFVARFPTLDTLAAADIDEVIALWAGLGYYARARNLHRCAQTLVASGGHWPRELDALGALPGIGRSTAAAILAQAFGLRHAILDGNVRRLLARHRALPLWPGSPAAQKQLWALAEALLPEQRLADYTQAQMDLGATLCRARKPACSRCPLASDCLALHHGRVDQLPLPRPRRSRGSRRQQLLLIQDASGAYLIERRPPAGIWGALWCPPLADADTPLSEVEASLGLALDDLGWLPSVHHAFTHFDLQLLPRCLRLRGNAAVTESAERRWFSMHASSAQPGLPAPVRKLLAARSGLN